MPDWTHTIYSSSSHNVTACERATMKPQTALAFVTPRLPRQRYRASPFSRLSLSLITDLVDRSRRATLSSLAVRLLPAPTSLPLAPFWAPWTTRRRTLCTRVISQASSPVRVVSPFARTTNPGHVLPQGPPVEKNQVQICLHD